MLYMSTLHSICVFSSCYADICFEVLCESYYYDLVHIKEQGYIVLAFCIR